MPAGQPGAGRVHTVSDGTSTVTLGYDADGHVVSRAYSDGTATSAAYLDNGLLTSTTDVTGARHDLRLRRLGRMKSATQTRGGHGARLGRLHLRRHVPGPTDERGQRRHDDQHVDAPQPADSQRTTTASGAVVEEHAYTYDGHGNVATRTDTYCGRATWTTKYRYDAYDRLLGSAVYTGAARDRAARRRRRPTP